jgi:hypothetical protein
MTPYTHKKVKLKLRTLAITILTLLICNPAWALFSVPTLRLGLGYSPIKFTAGSVFTEGTSLGSLVTVNPMFLWDVPSLRSRFGFHFLADVGSSYGFVSTAGVGVTGIMYPLGLSSSREVAEDFSEVVKTRVGPFLQFSITPTKFSVTKTPETGTPQYNQPSSWDYFNVKVVEISAGAGVDYPLGRDLIGFIGAHYRAAAFKELESGDGSVSYSGLAFILGVMTNFY